MSLFLTVLAVISVSLAFSLLFSLAVFRENPEATVAIAVLLLFLTYSKTEWASTEGEIVSEGYAIEAGLLRMLHRPGEIPLDSPEEQKNWGSKREEEQAFRNDGIHITFPERNCLASNQISRELDFIKMPFSIRACAGESGEDGALAFVTLVAENKTARLNKTFFSSPIRIFESSCVFFNIDEPELAPEGGRVIFWAIGKGNCSKEDIVLTRAVPGRFGEKVEFNGSYSDSLFFNLEETSQSCGVSRKGGLQLSDCSGCNGSTWASFSSLGSFPGEAGALIFSICGGNFSGGRARVNIMNGKTSVPADISPLSCTDYFVKNPPEYVKFAFAEGAARECRGSATISLLQVVNRTEKRGNETEVMLVG